MMGHKIRFYGEIWLIILKLSLLPLLIWSTVQCLYTKYCAFSKFISDCRDWINPFVQYPVFFTSTPTTSSISKIVKGMYNNASCRSGLALVEENASLHPYQSSSSLLSSPCPSLIVFFVFTKPNTLLSFFCEAIFGGLSKSPS